MRNLVIFILILAVSASLMGFAQFNLDTFSCDQVTEIPHSECQALVALYDAAGGQDWIDHTNWLVTSTPQNWFGVTVSGGSVTGLQLNNNHLYGSLPYELGWLAKLDILNLSSNLLFGPIPTSLGNLSRLMTINISNNQLTGPIPPSLGNLTNLWILDLSWNQLSGSIPPELGILPVWQFDLSANNLSGSIPSELGSLPNVVEFQLQGNDLTESIPAELGSLITVQRFNLSYNQLSGSIPPQLGNLVNLRGLYLYHNSLSGTIPAEIGNLVKLEILALDSNQLTGPIPEEMGNLNALTNLELSGNPLNTPFPLVLTNITTLKSLLLASTRLSGLIPEEISNLTNLETLFLTSNQLVGDIPPKMVDLVNLTTLELGYNHLKVPANPQVLADFLAVKDPDWYKTQAFDQVVDSGTEATVTALDGSTVIHIYSASLETDVTFTFVPQLEPNEDTGTLTFAGNSFLLNAINQMGDPVKLFSQPLVVDVYYDESTIGNVPERRLALYYWDLDAGKWLDVVSTCKNGTYTRNFEANMFSVPLCHLSEFSLMDTPEQTVFLPLILN